MASAATSEAVGLVAPPEVRPESDILIEIVHDYRHFLDLEEEWSRVLSASEINHPFLEHAWVRTWWECFSGSSSLYIIVAKFKGRMIAIAPLILTRVRMWGIPLRRLGFFYNAHVPRADFIVGERHDQAYQAIWKHLAQSRCWDLLQLCQLPADSKTLSDVQERASPSGFPCGLWLSGESPYLSIGTSWREYFDALPTKHRANLRNRVKRLAIVGDVSLETVTDRQLVPGALADGLNLEAAAWKNDAGTAICCDRDVERFYQLLAERTSERGWLQLNFIRADTRRIAFDYSLNYRNRVYLLKLGYDPTYSPYSPSNLLLQMTLERSFSTDVIEYDFLGDSAEWKRRWTAQARPHHWLFVFSNSIKGRLAHVAKFKLTPFLKRDEFRPLRKVVRAAARFSGGE
jgi:CelD/BcsL family acetyltransferase involved in cellulose biosynthesis